MRARDLVGFLDQYRDSFEAPVEEHSPVESVTRTEDGYEVETQWHRWRCQSVVIATGACGRPNVPDMAKHLPASVLQIVPKNYKNPKSLPKAGVLVVGASASGIQIAEEIHRSGRPVTLAVGRHTRLPRRYRGRDIMWWLESLGFFSQSKDDVANLEAARGQPSLQLIGRPESDGLHLGKLRDLGVRVVGRARAIDGRRVKLSSDLDETVARSERKLTGILDRIDAEISRRGWAPHVDAPDRPATLSFGRTPGRIDLDDERIETVLWATGYRSSYPWLRVPVVGGNGELIHDGGVTPAPGLYTLGLRFLRRRNSNFIDGVGDDARVIANHIAKNLRCASRAAA